MSSTHKNEHGADDHALLPTAPTSTQQLRDAIRAIFSITPGETPLIEGHAAPMHYLTHAFFQGDPAHDNTPDNTNPAPRDCVVWANRGGGKTFYAALATALDLLYKPGIEIKLVAGSREQSARMFTHLAAFFTSPKLAPFIDGRISLSRLTLTNGSNAEILSQSHASVRGARPQIIRCDEVELFDQNVWEAIQLAPRSRQCGDTFVKGAIEALSTWHIPLGLMSTLLGDRAHEHRDNTNPRSIFRWGVIDVLETCPPERPCEPCPLLDECEGRAKNADGHVYIEDAITLKQRASRESWHSEMLTLRPSRRDAVYPEFDPDRHVTEPDDAVFIEHDALNIGGMDFGFRSPAVVLWARLTTRGVIHVLHEHSRDELTLEKHIEIMKHRDFPALDWIGVDPAGNQRSDQTGLSAISQLKNHGFKVRASKSPIETGIRAIRQRLDPAVGTPTLYIHPRCTNLIRAITTYRFPSDNPHAQHPVKDGPDHACDALRYMITNIGVNKSATVNVYW